MKLKWVVGVLLVVLVALGWLWVRSQPQAVVEVVRATRKSIRAYVEEEAVTELPQDHLISMPISGWLEPITLREGDSVQAGQVVARLETDDLKDRVTQAEQRVAILESQIRETEDNRLEENLLVQAEATVKALDETVKAAEAKLKASEALREFARAELERQKRLFEARATPERELREAELQCQQAEAKFRSDSLELAALKTIAAVSYIGPKFVRDYMDRKSYRLEQLRKELVQAKAELEMARRNLRRAEIRSPVDGVVLKRFQTRRQYLLAGTPLLTIGQLDQMEVVAEVLTQRAPLIAIGSPVEIFGEGLNGTVLKGQVVRIHPAGFKKISSLGVEQQRVKVVIKPERRPPSLGVGFRVYVRIVYDRSDRAVVVPRTSLFRDARGRWHVLVVQSRRVVDREVAVGILNDEEAEVRHGVEPGELVVLHPSSEISAGMQVEPVEVE